MNEKGLVERFVPHNDIEVRISQEGFMNYPFAAKNINVVSVCSTKHRDIGNCPRKIDIVTADNMVLALSGARVDDVTIIFLSGIDSIEQQENLLKSLPGEVVVLGGIPCAFLLDKHNFDNLLQKVCEVVRSGDWVSPAWEIERFV